MIPKIIWQTHEYEYDDLPDLYKINSQTYKDLDGWEYRYRTSAQRKSFISEHFPEYMYLYEFIKPGIYQSDFWRYLVLYKYGGFYADMDSRIFYHENNYFAKTINDPDATFNVITSGTVPFNNCIILCSKESPIMKEIIEAMVYKCKMFYEQEYNIFPHSKWIHATGPKMYSKIICKNIENISYIYAHTDEVPRLGAVHSDIYKDEIDKNRTIDLAIKPKSIDLS